MPAPKAKPKRFPARRYAPKASAAKFPSRASAFKKTLPEPALSAGFWDARGPGGHGGHNQCISPLPSVGNYSNVICHVRTLHTGFNAQIVGKLFLMTNSRTFTGYQEISVAADPSTGAPADSDFTPFRYAEMLAEEPLTVRPSRKTLTLDVTTKADGVEGLIHVVNVPEPVVLAATGTTTGKWTAATVQNLISIATSSQNSRQMSMAQLAAKTHSWSLGFASAIHGSEYQTANVEAGASTPANPAAEETLRADASLSAQSMFIMWVPRVATDQTLAISVCEQMAVKFPAKSILARMTVPVGFTPGPGFMAGNQRQASGAVATEEIGVGTPAAMGQAGSRAAGGGQRGAGQRQAPSSYAEAASSAT